MISTLSLVFMTIFVIFSRMDYLSKVKSRLYFEGNVDARLDYWNNGIQIFINHIFFGVGPDQFQKYAATYRDANQVLRDGAMVVPDKAHNTLIDQFANGGVFVGLLWCAFVVLVSVQPLIVSKLKIDFRTRSHIAVLSAIWFGYIFQALVSPDQLQLSVLGYASAALLFRECHKIRIPKLK
jgi:O-antigen ligase